MGHRGQQDCTEEEKGSETETAQGDSSTLINDR
jgi:hypothetical protein